MSAPQGRPPGAVGGATERAAAGGRTSALRERIATQSNDGDPMTDPGGGKTSDGGARWRSSALPLALLFLALATVFLFGGGRGHFYHKRGDDLTTWNRMTVAENLSPEHGFLGFYRLTLDDDGNRTYVPYNRFPVLGYVLIKLVTLPFPDLITIVSKLHLLVSSTA